MIYYKLMRFLTCNGFFNAYMLMLLLNWLNIDNCFLLLYDEGLSEFREKWTTNRLPPKLSRWTSIFVSPSGEHVAIVVGNEITILQRDDNYQEPCGIFTSKTLDMFKCLLFHSYGAIVL